jgi:hypothetical protein
MQHATSPPRAAVLALLGVLAVVASATLCVADVAHAGACTVDALPASGTVTPAHFNRRFDQVESCINGRIGDANLSSSEPISTTNLAKPAAYFTQSVQLACGTKASAFAYEVGFAGEIVSLSVRCRDCAAADHTITLKVGASTVKAQNVTNSTIARDSTLTTDFAAGDDIIIDTTQMTAGSCSAYDVVVGMKTTHQTAP